jgi:hypothetical protein
LGFLFYSTIPNTPGKERVGKPFNGGGAGIFKIPILGREKLAKGGGGGKFIIAGGGGGKFIIVVGGGGGGKLDNTGDDGGKFGINSGGDGKFGILDGGAKIGITVKEGSKG